MRRVPRSSSGCRGSSTVELALLLPMLASLVLFSVALMELAVARLRVQEVARFVAWELSRVRWAVAGAGQGDPEFAAAQQRVLVEAQKRFYPSGAAEALGGWMIQGAKASVSAAHGPSPAGMSEAGAGTLSGDGGSFAQRVLNLARTGVVGLLEGWGFNVRSWIQSEASFSVRGRGMLGLFLPSVPLTARAALLGDSWALLDGADSAIAGGRAGNHRSGQAPSGLYLQVRRMTFLGAAGWFDQRLPFLHTLRSQLPLPIPSFGGSFVVSHNYGPLAGPRCDGIPGYPDAASSEGDARGGLSNLSRLLDHDRPACFDTAPFRDTEAYAASLYARIFHARGPYFMGCQRPQADDPSTPEDENRGDRVLSKTDCERNP